MKLQQYLINHYLHIPYDNFSYKAISALGILTTIKHNAIAEIKGEKINKLNESIKRVEEIISITDAKTQVSLFVLDRNVIREDITKKVKVYITNFKRKKIINNSDTVQLTADQIQDKLCNATMEINQILMTEIAAFSDQMSFEGGDL